MSSPASPDGTESQISSPQSPGSSSSPPRILTADVVKGIAIILMVFGHTEQGGNHRHWWDGLPRFFPFINFADSFIYSFHMPAFFLLAGLFIPTSLVRRGPLGFARERLQTLLYPYLLWGLMQGLTSPLTAPFRQDVQPFNWRQLLTGLVTGGASWFLLTLFVCQILALLLRRIPSWLLIPMALVGPVLANSIAAVRSGSEALYETLLYFPFICIGMALGAQRFARVESLPKLRAFFGFAIVFAIQVVAVFAIADPMPFAFVPLGLTGTAMLVLLAVALRDSPAAAGLRWCGEASIAIFLMAPFLQGIGRELVLHLLHTTYPAPQLIVPVVLATIVPALLWHARVVLHLDWMFRWPSQKQAGQS